MSEMLQGIEALKAVDDLDTRKEVMYLFQRLSSPQRRAFLHWAMTKTNEQIMTASDPPWVLVEVTLVNPECPIEAFGDLWMMTAQYGLPLQLVLQRLERYTRTCQGVGLLEVPDVERD